MIKKITVIAGFYVVSGLALIAILFAVSAVTRPDRSSEDSAPDRGTISLATATSVAAEVPPPRATPMPPAARRHAPEPRRPTTPLASMLPRSTQLRDVEVAEEPEAEEIVETAPELPAPAPKKYAAPPPRPDAPTISADEVVSVVKRKKKQVKTCYEKQLKGEPNLFGVVQVGWTVTASGSVKNVEVISNNTGNADMEACIERTIAGWSFPSSEAGVDIEYPFKFRPAF